MKLTIDLDRIVENAAKYSVKGYDKARNAAPVAKSSFLSLKDRVSKAAAKGKKAARKKTATKRRK